MRIFLKKDFAEAFAAAHKGSHNQLARVVVERYGRYGEDEKTFDTALGEEHYGPGVTAQVFEDLLYNFAQKTKNQSVMIYIGSVRLALKDITKSKPGSLPALQAALIEYLKKDAIDGWVYKEYDGKYLPFVVNKVYLKLYSKSEKARSEGLKDYVRLSFVANSTAGTSRRGGRNSDNDGSEYDGVRWEWGDFNKKTVPELLTEAGIFHESPELKANYLRQLELYDKYRPMYGKQFVGDVGSFEYEYDPEDTYGSRSNSRQLAGVAKYINDEMGQKRGEMVEERSNSWWMTEGGCTDETLFRRIPVHPYLRMFNLGTHLFSHKHVDGVKPYVYNPSLRDKIVLPEAHRDLIEVLVGDLEAVAGDVIEGKGGGTSILCQGDAGLGKTLTAEIYSEVKELPLYKVHSGQLGTTSQAVETALKLIFDRAQKWGCILLLDEADVYIRRRGDDLHHNAVVACFLRTMEYFSGIFFMTTNRKDDVDDAIRSRCLAIITFELPDAKGLRQIFAIHSENFKAGLSEVDLDLLADHYTGKIGGRDAKMLVEIASRYAIKKERKVDSEMIRMLAQFKGF